MRTVLKRLVQTPLAWLGYEIQCTPTRHSLQGVLAQVANTGWRPTSVLDVGAAYGTFTQTCAKFFPNAHYLLVEPLQEYQPFLKAVTDDVLNVMYASVAVGKQEGDVPFHVHKDWVGSSVYRETEGKHVDGKDRTVPLKTLDTLCHEYGLSGPYFIKVDVQGAELEVMAGAQQVLSQTEVVILETSLFQFFVGGPQFYDIVSIMKTCRFVAYDVFGLQYRLLDGALSQVDLLFVREEGIFRQQHIYATREQRASQDASFVASRRRRIDAQ